MASHLEKKNDNEVTGVGSVEQEGLSKPPDPPSNKEQPASSKKRRRTEGNKEVFFKLFKYPEAGEEYLLEMHEVETGGIYRCHLLVCKDNGRWRVRVYDLEQGYHVVLPILQDPNPPKFHKKYEFSLQERLRGWRVEDRKRGNGNEDKLYYHGSKQFRSFLEMAAFIVYSSKIKDLKLISNNQTTQGILEAKAVGALMIISTCEPCNTSSSLPDDDGSSEQSPQTSNEKPGPQEGENEELTPAEAQDEDQNKLNLADTPGGDQSEAGEIENEFMAYVHGVFQDEAPQSMNEILGEPKHGNFKF